MHLEKLGIYVEATPFDMTGRIVNVQIFSTGKRMPIHVTETYCDLKTTYHDFQIIGTREFGKCLIINDCIQTSETDHEMYDSEILVKLRLIDRKILILGGGDAYVATYALQVNPSLNITVVDIDEEITNACLNYLHTNQKYIREKISFVFLDALEYLKNSSESFDGIVCDLTDSPIGTNEKDEFTNFYHELLLLLSKRLNKYGWVSIQAGSTNVSEGYIPTIEILTELSSRIFKCVNQSSKYIPSYGEEWSFLFNENVL